MKNNDKISFTILQLIKKNILCPNTVKAIIYVITGVTKEIGKHFNNAKEVFA